MRKSTGNTWQTASSPASGGGRGAAGFTVAELVVCCGIVLTLACLSVATLLRSREAAHQAAAVATLRAIHSAQFSYAAAHPEVGFAASLQALAEDEGDHVPAGGYVAGLDCTASPCRAGEYAYAMSTTEQEPRANFTVWAVSRRGASDAAIRMTAAGQVELVPEACPPATPYSTSDSASKAAGLCGAP